MPSRCGVVLLSLGSTLSCVGWGRLIAIVACYRLIEAFLSGDHCLRAINTQNDFLFLFLLNLLYESLNA